MSMKLHSHPGYDRLHTIFEHDSHNLSTKETDGT